METAHEIFVSARLSTAAGCLSLSGGSNETVKVEPVLAITADHGCGYSLTGLNRLFGELGNSLDVHPMRERNRDEPVTRGIDQYLARHLSSLMGLPS
jgi:hypothetical protein